MSYLQQPCIYYGIGSPTRFKEQPFLYLFLFFSWIYKINKNEAIVIIISKYDTCLHMVHMVSKELCGFWFPVLTKSTMAEVETP